MSPEAVGVPLADLGSSRVGRQAGRLRWLNALPAEEATRELLACCEALLDALHRRLDNDPAVELRVAAAEQRKITALRLDKLLRQ